MRWRYPVAARLTSILVGLAVLTLVMASLVQDRALSRGLNGAAATRLDGAARATGRLLGLHLRELAARYAAVSHTPELRAQLEVSHGPTLARMAESLARQTGAANLIFLDDHWNARARFGAESSGARLIAAWRALPGGASGAVGAAACARLDPSDGPANVRATGIALPCVSTVGATLQETLLRLDGRLQASVLVPLTTGKRRVGALLVSEPVANATLDAWSELVGARITAVEPSVVSEDPLVRTVIAFPDLEIRVSSSMAPELATLAATRRHQAFAGVVALLIALGVSALLARDFLRPIREIQRATEQVGRGNLDARLDSSRRDEIGDVARVLDHTLDRLRSSQKRLRNVQRIAKFGDWSADLENNVVEGSPEFESVLGLAPNSNATVGTFLRCFAPADRAKLDHAVARCAKHGIPIELDLRRPGQGEEHVVHLRALRVAGGPGETRLEGSVQDITDRRRAEEQIRFLAFHDSLTGLPNRRFLSERMALAVTPGQPDGFSVLFFDLDRFKLVNDTLGHSAGDELLRIIGQRLVQALPHGTGAAVARFGGDEFALLLPGMVEERQLSEFAAALLETVAAPLYLQAHEMVVTGSVGIARWPEDGETIEAVLRGCDTALHQAKEDGRNGFRLYDSSMEEAANSRWKLENRLRRAIDSMHFELYYQPRIAAADGSLAGFEALLRWNDEDFGGYRPDEFLPIAEETGLIIPLGTWVLRSVVHQIRSWLDAGLRVPIVSVNLSGRQLTPDLVDIVRDALAGAGVASSHLELEVTESAVIADAEVGVAVLRELRGLGLRVSLDDFGTGYSSLSYLRNLPISGLKIDRSFVRSIASDGQDAALIASIISMAKVLDLHIIAEGVETEEQFELLVEMGCDELQGFLFGEPAPPEHARLQFEEKPPFKRARRRSRKRG